MARTSAAAVQVLSAPEALTRQRKTRSDCLDPRKLTILPQVRPDDEYLGIEMLADSIAKEGLLEDPLVVELDEQHIRPYLKFFSIAFDKKLTMRHVVADIRTGHYFIVVFGHRRTLAVRHLLMHGCSRCATAEECMEQHLAEHDLDLGMPVKIRLNLDPLKAYEIQDLENTKRDVSRHAQVQRLRMGWEIASRIWPKLTKSEYAHGKNREPEDIYDAIRYCELPKPVHEAVKLGTTSYTVALELTRLQAAGFDEQTIVFAMQYIRTEGMTATQAARYVTGKIEARHATPIQSEDLFVLETADVGTGLVSQLERAAERRAFATFAAEATALRATARAIEAGLVPRTKVLNSDLVRNAIRRGDSARKDLTKV